MNTIARIKSCLAAAALTSGLILLASLAFAATVSDVEWQLVENEDGILIYVRPSTGCAFNTVKGVTVINAPIDVLGMVLQDIPSFPLWMSDCKSSPILEKTGRNDYIFYYLQAMPWPAQDRETVLRAQTHIDWEAGYFEIDFKSIDYPIPGEAGTNVRMTVNGRFLLEYLGPGKTQVTYAIQADPGGYMPAVVSNMISRKVPRETLSGMRVMAGKQKYFHLAENAPDSIALREKIRENKVKHRKRITLK